MGYTSAIISITKALNHPSLSDATSAAIDLGLSISKTNPWVASGVGLMQVTGLEDKILNNVYKEK